MSTGEYCHGWVATGQHTAERALLYCLSYSLVESKWARAAATECGCAAMCSCRWRASSVSFRLASVSRCDIVRTYGTVPRISGQM